MTKFQIGRYGSLLSNPIGAHVILSLRGRDLLGEVTAVRRDYAAGCFRLTVKHFNGEPWPIEPAALAVDVLERTYPEGQP